MSYDNDHEYGRVPRANQSRTVFSMALLPEAASTLLTGRRKHLSWTPLHVPEADFGDGSIYHLSNGLGNRNDESRAGRY